jgi:dTDP-4-amino-4,6-dideoxygalactose transaminase
MTDRPALAEAIVYALDHAESEQWYRTAGSGSRAVDIVARVLAEHETHIDVTIQNREAVIVHLEQQLAALQAEHERLRAAVASWVKDFEQWRKHDTQGYDTLVGLVWSLLEDSDVLLASFQQPATSPMGSPSPSTDHS